MPLALVRMAVMEFLAAHCRAHQRLGAVPSNIRENMVVQRNCGSLVAAAQTRRHRESPLHCVARSRSAARCRAQFARPVQMAAHVGTHAYSARAEAPGGSADRSWLRCEFDKAESVCAKDSDSNSAWAESHGESWIALRSSKITVMVSREKRHAEGPAAALALKS